MTRKQPSGSTRLAYVVAVAVFMATTAVTILNSGASPAASGAAPPGVAAAQTGTATTPTPTPVNGLPLPTVTLPPIQTPTPDGSFGPRQCQDAADNDGDNKVDYPNDPGCLGPTDNDETDPVVGPPLRDRSRVTIGHTTSPRHEFTGKVRSDKRRCRRNRRVVVKKEMSGPDQVVGRDKTNRRGRYRVPHTAGGAGDYYSIAKKKRGCRRARSNTLSVSS